MPSSSSSASLECTLEFKESQFGRQATGVGQPYTGLNYPLILPSEDVRYLLSDFYISFDQPSDYGPEPEFERPFYIF